MVGVAAISTPIWVSSPTKSRAPKAGFTDRFPQNPPFQAFPFLSAVLPNKHYKAPTLFSLKIKAAAASSSSSSGVLGTTKKQSSHHLKSLVGVTDYTEEPATNVKFQTSLNLTGCSSSLSLLGTGYREKVFAIIGVKVYAAGLYVDLSILNKLEAGKGKSAAEIQGGASIFDVIFQATLEKSLQIVLVRDVDGKTFWGALDDAISPRIKSPTPDDESALSTFRSIFQGRSLKKGTFIFLTWLDPTKMLVSVSSAGMPSGVDARIESKNVSLALFDVFFGSEPVSPSLKASVATGLATALK